MKTKVFTFIFCVMFLTGCATTPMRTPNLNNPSSILPERVIIEGIKIERGQSFRDCVPVALEAIFKFYRKNIDRKEIDEKIHKGWGTKISDMLEYAKDQKFNSYSFTDQTQDKRKIKFYLAQHFPVLVTGKRFSGGWTSHIVILVGYDDGKKIFHVADPERRAIKQERYLDFNEWHEREGSRGYIIYPPSQSIEKLK